MQRPVEPSSVSISRELIRGLQDLQANVRGECDDTAAWASPDEECTRRLAAEARAWQLQDEVRRLRQEVQMLRAAGLKAPASEFQTPPRRGRHPQAAAAIGASQASTAEGSLASSRSPVSPPSCAEPLSQDAAPTEGWSRRDGVAPQRPDDAPGRRRSLLDLVGGCVDTEPTEKYPHLRELSAAGKAERRSLLSKSLLAKMRSTQTYWDGRPYEAMIFEGGGTKGMVYAGALQRVCEAGLLKDIKYFAGTSAGAQTAALAAVGYSGEELREVMMNTPWDRLLDKTSFGGCLGCIPNLYRLFTEHGWCKGKVLQDHLEELISRKVGPNCTLRRLYEERGVVLRVGACNVTTRRFELLDHETHPNMPIALAARASSNIPVLFVPVKYESVSHPGKHYLYVDGGLEGNIPVKSFPGKRTLAFDLMSSGDWHKEHGNFVAPEGLTHFVGTILDMVMNSAQAVGGLNHEAHEEDPAKKNIHIVKINCGEHKMLETAMTEKQVLHMVADGWDAVDDFFETPPDAGGDRAAGPR